MKKALILILSIVCFGAFGQIPALNNIVRNNTLTPVKVANALDGSKAYTATGTDTYSVTVGLGQYTGGLTYASGDMFTITFTNANTSTTVTLNVDSEGAVALKNNDGTDPDIASLCAGCTFKFRHNGTNFRMVGASGGGSSSVDWGDVGGDINDQLDLQAQFAGKQTVDADLTMIAGLSPSNDDILQRKSGNWTNRTLAQIRTDLALVADAINDGTTTIAPSQNAVFDALALKAEKYPSANRQTASYTGVLSDAGKVIEMNVASANVFTIPTNASVPYPIGTRIDLVQYGAGQTSVSAPGVTLRSSSGSLATSGQYSVISLYKIGTDEWYVWDGTPTTIAGASANELIKSNGSIAVPSGLFSSSSGIITTGTWNGTVHSPTYGGTGKNNGANTLEWTGGNLSFVVSGNNTITFPNANITVARIDAAQTITGVLTLVDPPVIPAFTLANHTLATTQSPGDNDTDIATTAFVTAAVSASGGSPWDLGGGGTFTAPNIVVGSTTNTLKFRFASISTSITDNAYIIENPTAAALGAQQYSPSFGLGAKGWGTTASTSQPVEFWFQAQSTQAAVPTGLLVISSSVNGGARSNLLTINSNGGIVTVSTLTTSNGTASANFTIGTAAQSSATSTTLTNSGTFTSAVTTGTNILINPNEAISSGGLTYRGISIIPTFNFTGTHSGGSTTGVYYNPTATSMTGINTELFLHGVRGDNLFGSSTKTASTRFEIYGANNSTALLVEDDAGNDIFNVGESGGSPVIGFFGATPVVQQSLNTILVNNVTSGGTISVIADFTDLTIYANDAATIRNNIFRLTEKVLKLETALRNYGQGIN